MQTKALRITKSIALLLGVLVATWFLIACFSVHTETPSHDPWICFPEYYLPPLPLVVAPWIAARVWYGLSVFFGFGSFFVLPSGCAFFGPEMRHGFVAAMPPNFVPETLAFCCAGGFVAALVGWFARHLRFPAAPNNALQRTEAGGGASSDPHA